MAPLNAVQLWGTQTRLLRQPALCANPVSATIFVISYFTHQVTCASYAALGHPDSAPGAASALRQMSEACSGLLGPVAEELLGTYALTQGMGPIQKGTVQNGQLQLQERLVLQVRTLPECSWVHVLAGEGLWALLHVCCEMVHAWLGRTGVRSWASSCSKLSKLRCYVRCMGHK